MTGRRMRILHVYRTYLPDTVGGIEQAISQIAQGTVAAGHEAEVLALTRRRGPQTVSVGNHTAHRARLTFEVAGSGFSLGAFGLFRRLAARADLIHYHFPWPFMDMLHLAVRPARPAIVTYHSDIVRQARLARLYRPLMHRFLGAMDRIVADAPAYARTSPVLQRFADRVEVIPIGVDEAAYPAPDPQTLAHWRGRVGEGFFLFVGMLRYYKGLHVLLEAAAGTGMAVVIAGAGPLEAELKAQAAALRAVSVQFTGEVRDADRNALLTLARGFVFPSHLRAEAFGVALVEAAMFAKPMISCEIGTGTSYINLDGETGFVVPPQDPAALRQAMQQLHANAADAAAMGARARARYEALFTGERMVGRYLELYETLLRSRQ